MSVDEGHVNQAEFPEAAVQQAKEEYSADSDSFGEKDPFKLKKEKKDAEKKKKEKGYKTFEAESFSEEDDERGKNKKRGSSLFRSRFTPAKTKPGKDKEKQPPTPRGSHDDGHDRDSKVMDERRPSKDKVKEEKRKEKTKEEKKAEKMKEEKRADKVKEEKKAKGGGGGGVEEKAKWRGSMTEEKRRTKIKDREDKKTKKKSGSVDLTAVKKIEPVFGAPLAQAVAKTKLYDNIELPRVVRECVDFIEEYGLTTAGIYRLSGVKSKVDALKVQYDTSDKTSFVDCDATTITSLLKQYLRELPETVLTARLTPAFEHSAALSTKEEKVSAFKKVLAQLPKCNFTLLSWVMVHLGHVLEKKDETKMTIQNLSIVMSPSMRISHRTLNILFVHWKDLFGGIKLKKCPRPLEWVPGSVFEMPETTPELEDELLRHEAILAKMHEELNQGVANKNTEDDLWEVQRVVTQLKRKLRVSRRVSETRLAAKEKELETKEPKSPGAGGKEPKSPGAGGKEKSPAKTVSLPPSALKIEEPKEEEQKSEEKITEEPKTETPEVKAKEPLPAADEGDTTKETIEENEPKAKDETEEEEEQEKEISRRTDSEEEEEEQTLEPDLEMMKLLLLSQAEVVAEREELIDIRNDLHKRIEAEREEIARLQSSISEAQQTARRRGASVDSLDSSLASDTSSSESDDEEELQKILEGLIRENEELRRKNMQMSYNIHNEREACAELRVQIKLQEQMPQLQQTLAQVGIKRITPRGKVVKGGREERSQQRTKTATIPQEKAVTGQETVQLRTKKTAPQEKPVKGQESSTPREKAVDEGEEPQPPLPEKKRSKDSAQQRREKRAAISSEPLPDMPPHGTGDTDTSTGEGVESVKNENTNSNASPGDPDDAVTDVVLENQEPVRRRHLEETAL